MMKIAATNSRQIAATNSRLCKNSQNQPNASAAYLQNPIDQQKEALNNLTLH
jgi:hypothetical protein